jgi:hypothetical protein
MLSLQEITYKNILLYFCIVYNISYRLVVYYTACKTLRLVIQV